MVQTKLPSTRLCLVYEFDIPKIVKDPSSPAHDAACKKAAELSGLVQPSSVSAKATKIQNLNLGVAHKQPFDPKFHVANHGPNVRVEFFYDNHKPKMCVRVVTSLGDKPAMMIDGVTASRLAFHTMELLEGSETVASTIFPKHPPLKFGLRHQYQFAVQIFGTLIRIFIAHISMFLDRLFARPPPKDVTLVNGPASLFRFYQSDQAFEPSTFLVFRPDQIAVKKLLQLTEEWRIIRGLASFFYLINFSPFAAPGTTTNITDILSLKGRYAGAFARPGPVAPPPAWNVINAQFSRMIFVNNYGKHQHNFQAKPVAYVWDWLEMDSTIHGVGCITINGVFLCWARGMRSALEQAPFALEFGEPVVEITQSTEWFKTMGPYIPSD